MSKILVTGSGGQLGGVLVPALRGRHGAEHVIASDIRPLEDTAGPSIVLDVLDAQAINETIASEGVTRVYHLAAILSAKGEENPAFTWEVNMKGLLNILDAAREQGLERVFYPSTIAVFGPSTPKVDTPQETVLTPATVYGISKVAGENWCNYYHLKYGVDVRSVRYPGLIGHSSMPGGGTTDYAVEIFHDALAKGEYTCFLKADTRLPMMYMPDAVRATMDIMSAPKGKVESGLGYNIHGMSFSPEELVAEIRRHLPDFQARYEPDFREAIARSWIESVDDSAAQMDWGWQSEYNLERMVEDMLLHLRN